MVAQSSVHFPRVNVGMAKAHATKAVADPVLTFRMQLTKLMPETNLNDNGVAPNSPICPRSRSDPIHVLIKTREQFQGKYYPNLCKFKQVRTIHLARHCTGCCKDTRDYYCSYNPSMDPCLVCFGAHLKECGGQNNIGMNSWS